LATKEWAVESGQSFFAREFLTKNITVIPPPCFSVFPRLKIKLKGHEFDATEAESQAALNSFTEHDFQDVFKKMELLRG
jgi:hypothetical protein